MASDTQRPDRLFDLTGKHALVTGAGGGLGNVFALALARFGATVTCADRDITGALNTVAQIQTVGGSATAVHVDVAVPESVDTMVRSLGPQPAIDILVNNAGIASAPQRMHEISPADWQRVIRVNLDGTFYCTRAIVPLMLASGGSIINLSSVLGIGGFYPDFPATAASYGASKAAICGFTRQVAVEYARDKIRVNAIAPGWHMGTDLGRERRESSTPEGDAAFAEAVLCNSPGGRFGDPDELEGLLIYLASDASRFVTGQIFAHDGGWSAR
jgi:NAD(P)-dependent dehydrogenase (short-subunit alcohol dehydrogenase family)